MPGKLAITEICGKSTHLSKGEFEFYSNLEWPENYFNVFWGAFDLSTTSTGNRSSQSNYSTQRRVKKISGKNCGEPGFPCHYWFPKNTDIQCSNLRPIDSEYFDYYGTSCSVNDYSKAVLLEKLPSSATLSNLSSRGKIGEVGLPDMINSCRTDRDCRNSQVCVAGECIRVNPNDPVVIDCMCMQDCWVNGSSACTCDCGTGGPAPTPTPAPSPDPPVWGCTDTSACNFNEAATDDDGSCTYPEENYNCLGECIGVICWDGSCELFDTDCPPEPEIVIPGCTDELACNYDQTATHDNGTCDYGVLCWDGTLVCDLSECDDLPSGYGDLDFSEISPLDGPGWFEIYNPDWNFNYYPFDEHVIITYCDGEVPGDMGNIQTECSEENLYTCKIPFEFTNSPFWDGRDPNGVDLYPGQRILIFTDNTPSSNQEQVGGDCTLVDGRIHTNFYLGTKGYLYVYRSITSDDYGHISWDMTEKVDYPFYGGWPPDLSIKDIIDGLSMNGDYPYTHRDIQDEAHTMEPSTRNWGYTCTNPFFENESMCYSPWNGTGPYRATPSAPNWYTFFEKLYDVYNEDSFSCYGQCGKITPTNTMGAYPFGTTPSLSYCYCNYDNGYCKNKFNCCPNYSNECPLDIKSRSKIIFD